MGGGTLHHRAVALLDDPQCRIEGLRVVAVHDLFKRQCLFLAGSENSYNFRFEWRRLKGLNPFNADASPGEFPERDQTLRIEAFGRVMLKDLVEAGQLGFA